MTRTAIANVALKALGAGRIDDINDIDDVATSCRDMMDLAISYYGNEVITSKMITRQALVPSGTAVDGFQYSYAFPTSPPVLRPLRLASGYPLYPEGSFINTDDSEAVLVYMRSDFDAPDLPDYAGECIGLKLALLIAADQGKDERKPVVERDLMLATNQAKATEGRLLNPAKNTKRWGTL